jgi:hypothetical protein
MEKTFALAVDRNSTLKTIASESANAAAAECKQWYQAELGKLLIELQEDQISSVHQKLQDEAVERFCNNQSSADKEFVKKFVTSLKKVIRKQYSITDRIYRFC